MIGNVKIKRKRKKKGSGNKKVKKVRSKSPTFYARKFFGKSGQSNFNVSWEKQKLDERKLSVLVTAATIKKQLRRGEFTGKYTKNNLMPMIIH